MRRLTTKEIIERGRLVHGMQFNYDFIDYKNMHRSVLIQCNNCGNLFPQKMNDHLLGKHGCQYCYDLRRGDNRRSNNQEFITKARKAHGDTYNYEKVVYVNNITEVTITCKIHGDFLQKPVVHYTGSKSGCSQCSTSGFKPKEPAILYYFKDLPTGFYKTGITNRTVEERFSSHNKKEIKIIDIEHFELGSDAQIREKELLLEFKEFRIDNERYKNFQGGYTEFFNKDILNLDKEIS